MYFFDDQPIDPASFCSPDVPKFSDDSEQSITRPVQVDPATYAGLVYAVVVLSITLILLLGYIIWNHFAARRGISLNNSHHQSHNVEEGTKAHHNTPETPDTVVGIDSSRHPHIHMSGDGSIQGSHSYYQGAPFQYYVSSYIESNTTPATPAGSPVSPCSDGSRTSEISVGDRLRSQLMVRETTGDFPVSAESSFLSTLPLEENDQRSHSRSSLYTIPEAEAEASPTSSQEPTAPITPITALTQTELSSVPL